MKRLLGFLFALYLFVNGWIASQGVVSTDPDLLLGDYVTGSPGATAYESGIYDAGEKE